ncbi:MAG: NAD(P)H-quinone oxidoreductase subunit F [Thermostichales cyanobacterium BF4_bins_65]
MTDILIASSVWIPVYGVLGAVLTLPWAMGWVKRTGPRPAAYINLLMTVLAFGHGLALLGVVREQPVIELTLPWLQVLDLRLDLAFALTPVTVTGVVVVTGLSLVAQVYALGYLEKDWGLARFYGLMGFFEGAMSGIALSDSLLLSYALLEMLTLSTYLLVGFWYAQPLVVKAARDAFLTKRVGDLFLLMGVVAVVTLSGQTKFSDLADWAATATLPTWAATLVGLALIAGPIGKCAQFPLHLWLDEAMEGPNPASILRNSVVVGCGAWVLIKLQPVLALSPVVQTVLIAIGSVTAVGASLMAIAQIDLKRALSHTTSAYLGLVFLAVGLNQGELALQILLAHGLAKASLFMAAGSLILTTVTQDIRRMGGLRRRMPATVVSFVVGALGMVSLGALPVLGRLFLALPWSERPILLLVLAMTAMNLMRVYWRVFEGSPSPQSRRAPEVAWPMAVPMVAGIILNLLTPWWLAGDPLPVGVGVGLVLSPLAGAAVGYAYGRQPAWQTWIDTHWRGLQRFLAYDFYIEALYKLLILQPFAWGSRLVSWVDRYVVDGLVNGVSLVLLMGSESLKYSSSGRSQLYLLTILVGVLLLGSLLLPTLWGGT